MNDERALQTRLFVVYSLPSPLFTIELRYRNVSTWTVGLTLSVNFFFILDAHSFRLIWGPPSLLFNVYWGSLPGIKRLGREVNPPSPSSAEMKNE
jgi:hypothetical protein